MSERTIPLVELARQYAALEAELLPVLSDVLQSAELIGGARVAEFERAFAAACGVPHAVGVANGTDALALALGAAGIGPGDEVIVPVMTFVATAEAVALVGARPVFVDVDPRFGLLDPSAAAARIGPRTRAIVPVHLYGRLADVEALGALAARHDLALVEDAAQAHGARHQGRAAGSFGRAAAFSFYPGKNLGAYGDAGAVVTADPALAERVRLRANHGRRDKYRHELLGTNSRLDALQAAALGVKLPKLDGYNRARRALARRYAAGLADLDGLVLPAGTDDERHVVHLYVVRTPDRDALLRHLHAAKIMAQIHYPIPLHLQPALGALGHRAGEFPVAEAFTAEALSLPLSPELSHADQDRVIAAVRAFFRGARA